MYSDLGVYYAQGDHGPSVAQIQTALIHAGYLETGLPDGAYGNRTKEAVQHFQSDHGLAIDGIVGDETWKALMAQAPKPAVAPPTVTVPVAAQKPLPSAPTPAPSGFHPILPFHGAGLIAIALLSLLGLRMIRKI